MELAIILLLFAFCLIFFKLLAVIFKAGVFVLSIPFQIIGALFAVCLMVMLLPFVAVAGVLAVVFAPLLIIGPFLPLVLVLLGLYLVVKK